jgi:3-oxoacyl-[acyl-carrier protein] reductase
MDAERSFILSGAASGIGRHMAAVLAGQGHSLLLVDIDAVGLRRVAGELGADADTAGRVDSRVLDVRDADGWEATVAHAVERFGALDVMLNVAGYLLPGHVHEVGVEVLDQHVDVNVKGVMYATRAGARHMVRAGGGHIVNVASIAGISHVPGLAAYAASKHAVRGFSLSVAHELAAHGVAVSVVCPDAVETPMLDLQVGYDEAAVVFSGGRGLTLREVEKAMLEVLEKRPLERFIPLPGSGRALGARLANTFPSLTRLALPSLLSRGRAAQRKRRNG